MTADTKPPTLGEDEIDVLLNHNHDFDNDSVSALARAAFAKGLAAGAEAQRKRDASVCNTMTPPDRFDARDVRVADMIRRAIEARDGKP